MCIAVLGGMDRLQPYYLEEAEKLGVEVKLFAGARNGMSAKLKNVDALVIFTNKISHSARRQAVSAIKGQGIPIMQVHSCGVCTFRNCLRCLNSGASLE
jgi:hypothetical protein